MEDSACMVHELNLKYEFLCDIHQNAFMCKPTAIKPWYNEMTSFIGLPCLQHITTGLLHLEMTDRLMQKSSVAPIPLFTDATDTNTSSLSTG